MNHHVHLSTLGLSELGNEYETISPPLNEFTASVSSPIRITSYQVSGLVCFETGYRFYIYKPSIEEILSIPQPSCHISLPGTAAFGYIPCTNEHKLVDMFRPEYVETDKRLLV